MNARLPGLTLCACLVVSPFVLKLRNPRRVGGSTAVVPGVPLPRGYVLDLPGAIFADHARRLAEMKGRLAIRVLPELGRAREDTGGPALRAAGATPLVGR